MTNEHSHPTPSSIRDDSICESSLHLNKSSGDIVERLRNRLQRDRRGNFDPELSVRLGPGIYEEIMESAAEIERLRREVESWTAKAEAAWRREDKQGADIIELSHRALTAESAVAAAWEEAAMIRRWGQFISSSCR